MGNLGYPKKVDREKTGVWGRYPPSNTKDVIQPIISHDERPLSGHRQEDWEARCGFHGEELHGC